MATHMFRQLRRSSAALNLLRRQNVRLVSSCGSRLVFAAGKYTQQPCLLQNNLLARPSAVLGLRLFGDASAKLSVEDVQTRALNVVKLFDKVEPEKVTLESHFINDLGLDSLDVVEIVMAFEDEFVIEISDEEAEKIFTVTDAVEFVKKALDIH